MALSGIQIYKLLPRTNCKECGFPTCLAFAMKLAAKQVELDDCPDVNEESKEQLAQSSAPPIKLIELKSGGYVTKAGNEVVLFRHEKTFYNKPGVFININTDMTDEAIKNKADQINNYVVGYVGIDLYIDGIAITDKTSDPDCYKSAVKTVRSASSKPLILISDDPEIIKAGAVELKGGSFMVGIAGDENAEGFVVLAKELDSPLIITSDSLDGLAELSERISGSVGNLVLLPPAENLSQELTANTQIRRLALKNNFRPFGYPTIAFPTDPMSATQAVTKYSGFLVLEEFNPELVYPLLVLRQNIYTDPQKPIQVTPGIYEINNPKPEDPVLVTTNFSITYFSVANEVEGSGKPAWLVVTDAEGMSVLTAWAAGKFDAERIAKDIKRFHTSDKVSYKRIVLPGHVAVLSGELEEELPDWEILVGPREAVDIPKYLENIN